MADPRSGQAWVDLINECKQTYPWICHLCTQSIPAVHRDHPLAYQVDHIHPVATHPHLARLITNCRPSHRRCNRARGKRPLTPELIAALTARYGQPRPALAFFD